MSSVEPPEGPFTEHDPFDPVELSTESAASEFERVTARETARHATPAAPDPAAGGAVAPAAPAAEPNLLERALKAAGSDAARYLPVRFIPALTSLVTTPLFTRAIDSADYGAFYLLSSVASLLAAVAISWLQSASIRFYWPARKADNLNGYTSTIVWTGLTSLAATAAVTGAAAFLARDLAGPTLMRLVPVGLAYFIISFYAAAMLQVLRAANRASAYARLQVGSTLLVTALSVAFVWYAKWGALGILAAAAIGNLVFLPFILRSIRTEGTLSPRAVDRTLLREFLDYGLPLVPGGLAGWALVVLDRFIIQAFRGPAEVGVYSVTYGLGDKIMGLVTLPLLMTMMPSLIEAYEKHGQGLAEKVQKQFTRYFAILTFPLLAGMSAASLVFMQVFTGPDYREAYGALTLVAAGSMLGSFAQIAGAGLGIHKKTKLIMVNVLIAAAFNTVLNVIFVPRYGYMAAAWATPASYALLLVITWSQSRRYMVWLIPWLDLGRILAASAGMFLVVSAMTRYLPANLAVLLAQVVAGIVAYTALLLALGGVRTDERRFLAGMVSRGLGRLTGRRG